MRKLFFVVVALVGLTLYAAGQLGWIIWTYAPTSSDGPADAALVLGAAADGVAPSPVFEERLRHAVDLYARGRVQYLVLTGGRGRGEALAESEVGRDWAMAQGVPADAILIETESRTTRQNLTFARPLLEAAGIGSILLVTDPLHMRRAMWMADTLKLDARPSPTPTSRYESLATQVPMLFREVWFSFVWYFREE
ncbi:MAG: YdcF family protein [Hyphomicrobiales bacterium]|nr:MAG: YdcF family protein [Hyphomicrobiales bacterium]